MAENNSRDRPHDVCDGEKPERRQQGRPFPLRREEQRRDGDCEVAVDREVVPFERIADGGRDDLAERIACRRDWHAIIAARPAAWSHAVPPARRGNATGTVPWLSKLARERRGRATLRDGTTDEASLGSPQHACRAGPGRRAGGYAADGIGEAARIEDAERRRTLSADRRARGGDQDRSRHADTAPPHDRCDRQTHDRWLIRRQPHPPCIALRLNLRNRVAPGRSRTSTPLRATD